MCNMTAAYSNVCLVKAIASFLFSWVGILSRTVVPLLSSPSVPMMLAGMRSWITRAFWGLSLHPADLLPQTSVDAVQAEVQQRAWRVSLGSLYIFIIWITQKDDAALSGVENKTLKLQISVPAFVFVINQKCGWVGLTPRSIHVLWRNRVDKWPNFTFGERCRRFFMTTLCRDDSFCLRHKQTSERAQH